MKIAIPCTLSDLDGMVEPKLGTAAKLLIIETDDMSFEVLDGPPKTSGPGAGVAVISLVVSMGAQVILVGYAAPHIVAALKNKSIEIVTGVSGKAGDAVVDYLNSRSGAAESEKLPSNEGTPSEQEKWGEALKKGLRQFYSILPRMLGVILLLGLFRGFISEQTLLSFFSGSFFKDTLLGAALGSILAGNPVNSYVIGDSLLTAGVGLAGVLALLLTWVNVALIQLPLEAAALGWRFAIVRNFSGIVMAVITSSLVFLWGVGI